MAGALIVAAALAYDWTIREYIVDLEQLIDLAHSRVTRSLVDEECRQYLHLEACPLAPND